MGLPPGTTTDPRPAANGRSARVSGAPRSRVPSWLPIAIHAGWNVAQGAVFGVQVSGNPVDDVALLVGGTAGPAWLTGGAYGLEGSVAALAVPVAAVGVALVSVRRSGGSSPARGV